MTHGNKHMLFYFHVCDLIINYTLNLKQLPNVHSVNCNRSILYFYFYFISSIFVLTLYLVRQITHISLSIHTGECERLRGGGSLRDQEFMQTWTYDNFGLLGILELVQCTKGQEPPLLPTTMSQVDFLYNRINFSVLTAI